MSQEALEEVCAFLQDAKTYYLATVEGDQPHVRPFGTAEIFEGRLYIQTGRSKEVFSQLQANPKAEICAFKKGKWLRVAGTLVHDDRLEAEQDMLDKNPSLSRMYAPGDGNTAVLYFTDATATFSSFTEPPRTLEL